MGRNQRQMNLFPFLPEEMPGLQIPRFLALMTNSLIFSIGDDP